MFNSTSNVQSIPTSVWLIFVTFGGLFMNWAIWSEWEGLNFPVPWDALFNLGSFALAGIWGIFLLLGIFEGFSNWRKNGKLSGLFLFLPLLIIITTALSGIAHYDLF